MAKFPDLTFSTADERRPVAKKLSKYLPGDMSNLLAGIQRSNLSDSVPEPTVRVSGEGTPGEQRVRVLPRLRVLVPMIEPNVLHLARNYTLGLRHKTTTSEDGVFVVEWESQTDHADAYAKAYEHYLAHHEVVRDIGAGSSTDSWHEPMLIVPVRHTYADGSSAVSTLMAADGAARVWGARLALSADLASWHVNKEWSNPGVQWPLTVAAARDMVAAARINSRVTGLLETGVDPGRGQSGWGRSDGSVEDWADVLLVEPQMTLSDVATYLFHVHNTPTRGNAETVERLHTVDVEDWVESADVFSGRDPFEVLGLSAASAADREQVTEEEKALQGDLLAVVSNKDQTARRVVLAAVAMAQDAAPAPVFGDTDRRRVFSQYLFTALSKTRRLDHKAHATIMRLVRDLSVKFPSCDLYGISQDLLNPYLYEPMDDPSSEWFNLTALRALTYAVLHGHLTGTDMAYSRAYQEAARVEAETYDTAAEKASLIAEGLGLSVPERDDFVTKATEGLLALTDTPEFNAEVSDVATFADLPDNLFERLTTTPEGHRVVLAYAQHTLAGTIPENLFEYRVDTGGVQHVALVDVPATKHDQ